MAFDYSPFQVLVAWALEEYGESITFKRLSVDYATTPPTETWTLTGTVYAIVQPVSGSLWRHDAGFLEDSTHRILVTHDSGILEADRIFRSGDSNYFLVQCIGNWQTVMFQIAAKYVAGAM